MSKHGTHACYVGGCRLERCRKAANAYKRALYHRDVEASRARERERKRLAYLANPEKYRREAMQRYYAQAERYRRLSLRRYHKRRALVASLIRAAERTAVGFSDEYRATVVAATGELAHLIAEQIRDDSALYVAGSRMAIEFDETFMAGHLDEHDRDDD